MILPFSQHFDKKKQIPTYFAEKIWKTIDVHKIISELECIEYSNSKTQLLNLAYSKIETFNPKIHTIRNDFKNRWKEGNKIHPIFNNRSKNQFQFAPTFMCKGIQLIDIQIIDMPFNSIKISEINGSKSHFLTDNEIELLAINDGFENITDFFNWFNTDFKGKIIHFTDFRY